MIYSDIIAVLKVQFEFAQTVPSVLYELVAFASHVPLRKQCLQKKDTISGVLFFVVERLHPNANTFVFLGGFGVTVLL
jgi:hypothetical protein